MMLDTGPERGAQITPWSTILVALWLSLSGTILLGGPLLLAQQNVWWIAAGGVVSLFGAGFFLSRASKAPELFHHSLLAILYYGVVVAILFGGTLTDTLPEPLPGLGIGDSTFFFVWPLLQLAAAVLGGVAGGWLGRRGGRAGPASVEQTG